METATSEGTATRTASPCSNYFQFAPRYIEEGRNARFKEQAGCSVDDFLIEEPAAFHYHQLKADKSITWGEDDRKLEKEFRAQKDECERVGQPFTLSMVVADEGRVRSLTKNMPDDLRCVTQVFLFPVLQRLTDLPLHRALVNDTFQRICASRFESITEYQHIVLAIHLSWVECHADSDGFCYCSEQ